MAKPAVAGREITLRRYEERDRAAVRQMFVDINRELATPGTLTARDFAHAVRR